MNDNDDGISWRHDFTTNNTWQTIELQFNDFEAVFRGRKLPGVESLDASRIRQLGFLLADRKAGPFQLDISAIEFIDCRALAN